MKVTSTMTPEEIAVWEALAKSGELAREVLRNNEVYGPDCRDCRERLAWTRGLCSRCYQRRYKKDREQERREREGELRETS